MRLVRYKHSHNCTTTTNNNNNNNNNKPTGGSDLSQRKGTFHDLPAQWGQSLSQPQSPRIWKLLLYLRLPGTFSGC